MTGVRDHLDHQDDHAVAGNPRRAGERSPGPAIAGPADPRLGHAGGAATGLLHLQRTAGNAAVSSLVAPTVQRAVEIGEMTTSVGVADVAPPAQVASAAGGPGGPVTSDGGTTTITGSTINLEAAMTQTDGVIRAGTIIADSVVASSYTPGAGNMW